MSNKYTKLTPWRPAQPTVWQQFRRDPALFLARWLYGQRATVILDTDDKNNDTGEAPLKIVCISDTHNAQPAVPDGDVLIHAGDLTNRGSFAELRDQLEWLRGLPHPHKVVIAGNHDLLLDTHFTDTYPDRVPDGSGGEGTSLQDLNWEGLTYLNDSSVTLTFTRQGVPSRTLRVYGAPWTELCGLFAFQYPPVRPRVWKNAVPDGTDIVVVHGPPRGHLDQGGKGCPQLLEEIQRAQPSLVVCGHIHEGYGREDLLNDGVDRAYYAVETGSRGLWGVVSLAWWLLWRVLCQSLGIGWQSTKRTRLVNAAVMTYGWTGRPDGPPLREAIVVEL